MSFKQKNLEKHLIRSHYALWDLHLILLFLTTLIRSSLHWEILLFCTIKDLETVWINGNLDVKRRRLLIPTRNSREPCLRTLLKNQSESK
ncbi:unnamed protein product [Blepharisma stoltei]|uniref:Uncharacterized protein n=1 Tax=Blepharisma stoltei TaxID=1481888 RepID=A0AAU9I990_9CILI|nr:unnamed protein product [Blepharisma stoltei]